MNEDIFSGRKIVIATMHGKEKVMSPVLESELGLVPVTFEGLDTDTFGTFSGEIERKGTQLDAARAKALCAAKLAGVDLAVASEGSFDAHPANPFVQSNLELVLLVDLLNDFEVRGYHRTSKTNMDGTYVKSVEEAFLFADQIGFPDHGIIVRPSKKKQKIST